MSQEPLQLLLNVSANVKQARQARGLSQEKLATAAGVSRRMLVGIEAGESNVSLATLDRIAAALGMTFADIVRPPQASRGQAAPVQVWQGASADSHGYLLQSVTEHGCTMELWTWQIAPGERYDAEPDPAGTYEMLYVFSGTMRFELAGQSRTLVAGQSVAFASDCSYAYINAGSEALRFTKNVMLAAPRS
jgi:transcriptional regulator with XRE-family HTH domain